MVVSHKVLQPIDIIESPIQLNQCTQISADKISHAKALRS
jgi:hypothetical protein